MNLKWIKNFGWANLVLAMLLILPVNVTHARNSSRTIEIQFVEVALSSLPVEAKDTFRLIKKGGPYPYPRDGIVFGNFEKRLPKKQRGYYHEYTVKTPGVRSRGARRIVCGQPVECYYSDDHYQSFKLIKE